MQKVSRETSFEHIGRMVFGKFQWRLNRILERYDYTDEIAYGTKHEEFLKHCFMNGMSAMRTFHSLMMLEECGMIDLQEFRKRQF
jgi:hypothetical protein